MKQAVGKPSLFAFQDIITSVIGVFVLVSVLLALSISVETQDIADEQKKQRDFAQINLSAKIEKAVGELETLKSVRNTAAELAEMQKLVLLKIARAKERIKIILAEIERAEQMLTDSPDESAAKEMVEQRNESIKKTLAEQRSELVGAKRKAEELKEQIRRLKREITRRKDALVIPSSGSGKLGRLAPVCIVCSADRFEILGTPRVLDFSALMAYLASFPKDSSYIQFFFRPSARPEYFEIMRECKTRGITFGASAIMEDERLVYDE